MAGSARSRRRPIIGVLGPPRYGATSISNDTCAAVLAFLSLRPKHWVTASEIARTLWGDDQAQAPPEDPLRTLRTAVSRLRNTYDLGAERLPRGKSGQYRLEAEEGEIDLWCFMQRMHEADSLALVDPRAARREYSRALTLWPAENLPFLEKFPGLFPEYRRHLTTRDEATLKKLSVDLRCGNRRDVLAETERLAKLKPEDQRVTQLRALALYATDHPDAALDTIERLLSRLPKSVPPLPLLLRTKELIETGESAEPSLVWFTRDTYGSSETQTIDLTALERPAGSFPLPDEFSSPPTHLPQDERVRIVLENLQRWTQRAAPLFASWPGTPFRSSATTYRDWFTDLAEASEVWDFRYGIHERQVAPDAEGLRGSPLSRSKTLTILERAELLGMRSTLTPSRDEYDAALIMGGARTAPLLRTVWLAELSRDHKFHVVAFLGSQRPVVHPDEVSQTGYVAQATDATRVASGHTEFALLAAATIAAPQLFPLDSPMIDLDDWPAGDRSERAVWAGYQGIWRYPLSTGRPQAFGYSAPSDDPRRHRPRTAETLQFAYQDLAARRLLKAHDAVVLSTNAIYVPYQQIEALRVLALPHQLHVETVCHPREWTDQPRATIRNFGNPENYLQEVRSALLACAELAADFPEQANETFRERGDK